MIEIRDYRNSDCAALAVLIALATVISHAVLTARAVPATALRYE